MAVTVVNQTDTFDQWRVKTNDISSDLGDVSTLATTDTTSVVAAINELDTRVGELLDLDTSEITNVVGAVNELQTELGEPANLTTTAKTSAVDAINEHDGEIGDLNNLQGSETNLVEAVNNTRSFSIAISIALG
jgi:hypothetical protein